jgi:NAD(P)-dependent dehydrogenase (short-subunit alcohol dehydrogenase family)
MATLLIIGASSGIGASLAKQLIAAGHQVYGTYNSKATSPAEGFAEWQPLNVLDESPDLSFLPETLDGLVYCPGAVNLKPFARIDRTFLNGSRADRLQLSFPGVLF